MPPSSFRRASIRRRRLPVVFGLFTGLLNVSAPPLLAEPHDLDWLTTTAFVGSSGARAVGMVVQPDGEYVLTGPVEGNNRFDIGLARYRPDGTLDPTFGNGGIVVPNLGADSQFPSDLVLDSNGRIIVVGNVSSGGSSDVSVTRLNSDGSLDNSFGTNGTVRIDINTEEGGNAVAIQSTGKIVVAGITNVQSVSRALLLRLNTDGSLDNSFGNNGIVVDPSNVDHDLRSLVVDPNDRLLVGGYVLNGNQYDFLAARFSASGAIDNSFGSGGRTTVAFGQMSTIAKSLLLQPDGRIVIMGSTTYEMPNLLTAARLLADGSIDTSFGNNGTTMTTFGGTDHSLGSAHLRTDGRIVAFGAIQQPGSDYGFLIAQYLPDGSLDQSFDGDGHIVLQPDVIHDFAFDGTVLSDGRIVVAGTAYLQGAYDFALATFFPRPTPVAPVHAVPAYRAALDPNGGTCVDGSSHTMPWLAVFIGYRYLPDSTDCTRPGHAFTGWVDTATERPVALPALTDPASNTRRQFLASDASLTATWSPLPTALDVHVVLANFFCGPCSNVWIIHTPSEHATGYRRELNEEPASCSTEVEVFGLRACEIVGLASGVPLEFSTTPLNTHGNGPAATQTVVLND